MQVQRRQANKHDMMERWDQSAMVESVSVPLESEVRLACGLLIKLRYFNQAHSSKIDRTSITLQSGSESQELTLDLQTQRRWKDYAVALEGIVTPTRAKKNQPARQGSAHFRVEKLPQQHKSVTLGQPFALSVHDVARFGDGTVLFATQIGPHATELVLQRRSEHCALELGELGFGRWQNWVLTRDLVAAQSPCVAQLLIAAAAAPAPRLRFGQPFELQPGESVVAPDGLQLALGFVRNLANEPCVEVQLRLGALFRDEQIYRGRPREIEFGERYIAHVNSVKVPPSKKISVTLSVEKKGSASFEFGREFHLKHGESARGPDSIVIPYPAAGHMHYTDGRAVAFLDFQILCGDRREYLRVDMPHGIKTSSSTWDGYTLTVRADPAAKDWAFTVDKKPVRKR